MLLFWWYICFLDIYVGCADFFWVPQVEGAFVVLSQILFPCDLISSQIAYCFNCSLNYLLLDSLKGIRCQFFLNVWENFLYTYCADVCSCFLQRIKFFNLWHRFSLWVSLNISLYPQSLITTIKFILSSIFRGKEF